MNFGLALILNRRVFFVGGRVRLSVMLARGQRAREAWVPVRLTTPERGPEKRPREGVLAACLRSLLFLRLSCTGVPAAPPPPAAPSPAGRVHRRGLLPHPRQPRCATPPSPPLSWVRGDTDPAPPLPHRCKHGRPPHRPPPTPQRVILCPPPAGPSQVAMGGGPGFLPTQTSAHRSTPTCLLCSPLPPGDGAEAADFILDSGLTGSVVTPAAAARYRLPPLSAGVRPNRRRCAPTRMHSLLEGPDTKPMPPNTRG